MRSSTKRPIIRASVLALAVTAAHSVIAQDADLEEISSPVHALLIDQRRIPLYRWTSLAVATCVSMAQPIFRTCCARRCPHSTLIPADQLTRRRFRDRPIWKRYQPPRQPKHQHQRANARYRGSTSLCRHPRSWPGADLAPIPGLALKQVEVLSEMAPHLSTVRMRSLACSTLL